MATKHNEVSPFSFGADPELFCRIGENYISVEDNRGPLIPGTKKNPHPVKGGAIQVDGVAAEFNIEPSVEFNGFFSNIKTVIGSLKSRLNEHNPNINLVATPTATFNKDYFFKLPKHTLELGCDPDFNAYKDGEPNPRPQTNEPFRTGSGHIHIGWTKNEDPSSQGHNKDCCLVVKQLDKYLLYASKGWDTDEKRRSLYGSAGSFRPKSFGVEYRPLSNAWLKYPKTIQSVFYITLGVMRGIESGQFDLDVDLSYMDNMKDQSNTTKVMNRLHRYIPEVFK